MMLQINTTALLQTLIMLVLLLILQLPTFVSGAPVKFSLT